jgi:hypothetical protein
MERALIHVREDSRLNRPCGTGFCGHRFQVALQRGRCKWAMQPSVPALVNCLAMPPMMALLRPTLRRCCRSCRPSGRRTGNRHVLAGELGISWARSAWLRLAPWQDTQAAFCHQRGLDLRCSALLVGLLAQLRAVFHDVELAVVASDVGLMSWSLSASAMPRIVGCLRSPFLYSLSAASMYLAVWPAIFGTLYTSGKLAW